MNKEEIKKIVVDYINKNESASYAEVQWLFEEKGYDYKENCCPVRMSGNMWCSEWLECGSL
ncbi:hypothetical protein [Enterocloster sp.]|uniref:hypothetical protein n=1 Tax=Enterocloster sp. TaxID=2719315 RepID=UPI0039A1BD63